MNSAIPVFYFPERKPGGVQFLVIRICQELERRGLSYLIFDHADGFIVNALRQSGCDVRGHVDIKGITPEVASSVVNDEMILICFNGQECRFYDLFAGTGLHLLYWDVFEPDLWRTFILTNRSFFSFLNYLTSHSRRRFFSALARKSSIASVNEEGRRTIFRLSGLRTDSRCDVPILPVPIESVPLSPSYSRATETNERRLIYIGRPLDWKVRPFERVVKDYSPLGCLFTVVTTDEQEFSKHLELSADLKERVTYSTGIAGAGLEEYLVNSAYVVFAMGTSVLESARVGVPTVVMDYSSKEFPGDYRYRWFNDSEENDLGENVENGRWVHGRTAEDILRSAGSEYRSIGRQCRRKCSDLYAVEKVVDELLRMISESRFSMNDLSRYKLIGLVNWRRSTLPKLLNPGARV